MNIPEDIVHYLLYFQPNKTYEQLVAKQEEYLTILYSYLHAYIWQNDCFLLQVKENCLTGRVNVGECVEDEWFITFLLLKLTETDPELFIQIRDDDGEFLLIEAADHLPSWLEPELADNRVWLHQGSIHIIPKSLNGQSIPANQSSLTSNDAIQCILQYPQKTVANKKIQAAIKERISGFPSQIVEQQHHVNVIVPYRVACLLLSDQQTVSVATASFYRRDNTDIKQCRAMKHFSATDLVKIPVTFTRCLYAQITQQQFHPDFKAGWPRLAPTNPDYKALQLGMKLTCGFEIAMNKSSSNEVSEQQSFNPSSSQWKLFLQRLNKFNYFQNELEGSKLYNQLRDKAKQYFVSHVLSNSSDASNKYDELVNLYNKDERPITLQQLKEQENSLHPDDDEAWLNITPDQLDNLLAEKFGLLHTEASNANNSIADKVNKFASTLSGYEGVSLTNNKRQSADCDEPDGQEFFSFIQSMAENLDVDPLPEVSSSDGDELNDYASDSSSLSDDDDFIQLHRNDELSQLAQDKRSRQIRQEMRQMKEYMREMDKQLKKTDARRDADSVTTRSATSSSQSNGASLAVTEDLDSDDSLPDDLNDCGVPSRQEVDSRLNKALNLSFAAQQGRPGPSGTLLQSLGVDSMHQRASNLKKN